MIKNLTKTNINSIIYALIGLSLFLGFCYYITNIKFLTNTQVIELVKECQNANLDYYIGRNDLGNNLFVNCVAPK